MKNRVLRLITSYAQICCLCVVKCVVGGGGQITPIQDGDVIIRLPESRPAMVNKTSIFLSFSIGLIDPNFSDGKARRIG